LYYQVWVIDWFAVSYQPYEQSVLSQEKPVTTVEAVLSLEQYKYNIFTTTVDTPDKQ